MELVALLPSDAWLSSVLFWWLPHLCSLLLDWPPHPPTPSCFYQIYQVLVLLFLDFIFFADNSIVYRLDILVCWPC